ncbi:MAG: lysophospholipid acyltransferase family protein, partial [Bacteroidales bacterium]|nr:lysophospholipid acyltransferase family protein [Bacteroidales bacterium]
MAGRITAGMKYIAYIITNSLLRLLAAMPKGILYLNADFLYFLMYYIVGYRKNTVQKNLQISFPKLTEKELAHLAKKFYKHLADVIIENGVLQYFSQKRLSKMFRFSNPEILKPYYEQGRDVILMTAHYNNWEWTAPLSYTLDHLVVIVYKPLKNKYFDKEISKSRTKFGAEVVAMGKIGRALFEYKNKGIPTLTGMAGDQRPNWRHVQYWTTFLGQKTAILTGSEKLAKKFNSVVVFMKVRRKARGEYTAEIEVMTDDPQATKPNEITQKYTEILEKLILEEPSCWLWSHK